MTDRNRNISKHSWVYEDSSGKQSKRVVVADHEHDGNELQVTQGFRTHVAKKLGHLLDSYVTEMQTETSSCVASVKYGDDDDEGFRLFSTSVPGQTAQDTPAPVKRRPVPSSSDSDSEIEMRLREAAVSVKDLFPLSAQSSTLSPPTAEPPCPEKIKNKKNVAEGEESQEKVKQKKRRKRDQEEAVHADSADSLLNSQSNGVHGNTEKEHTHIKVKRKKKKKETGKIF
ncbi:protein CUSTOS isoform X2 [Mastacembelus armatus]|uniref:protein CUSTOS isoform X2 n=1 Tax=Mastacembelus armatus TaxID=205130 RepID=UPI000E45D5F5|nr:protein CUSTOS isoform X2 [Mastacembelus armatus]